MCRSAAQQLFWSDDYILIMMGEVFGVLGFFAIALWLLVGAGVFLYYRLRRLRIHLKMLLDQNRTLQRYSDAPEHSQEHMRLLEKAEACMRDYYAKKLDARGLLEFIADVVKMHMQGMDRMYFASLAECKIRSIAVL